jgi:RsiW-degrading membrane proteinase PrsW (M82 family)
MSDLIPPPNPADRIPPGAVMRQLVAPAPPVERAPKAPRKWLGSKGGLIIIGVLTAIWLYLVISDHIVGQGPGDGPTAILLGGFAVSAAFLYTMAYRLRADDRITAIRLVLAFLIGGLVSTLVAGPLNELIDHLSGGFLSAGAPSLLSRSTAGLVEELCKIAAVILVSRGLAVKNARMGLFIGGAVGFGFSAFEDMSYDVLAAHVTAFGNNTFESFVGVSVGRGILGPLEHPIFTALLAAALFGATRNGRYRITIGVIGAYLGVALVHGLIDSAGGYLTLLTGNRQLGASLGVVVSLLLAVGSGVAWLLISRRIGRMSSAPPPSIADATDPADPAGSTGLTALADRAVEAPIPATLETAETQ